MNKIENKYSFRKVFSLQTATAIMLTVIVLMPLRLYAQEIEPRTFANAPVGMNFIVSGFGYSEGGVMTDPSVPLKDAEIQIDGIPLAYARILNFWGRSGKFDIILVHTFTSGSATVDGELRERDVSGFADPKLRLSINLYGAPSLSLKEFKDYRQDLIIGASFQVSPPLGQYDSDRLLNIGTNRWSFKPEIGVSKAMGPLTLELAASAVFFTDNDEFYGNTKYKQDPIYAGQSNIICHFKRGVWGSLGGTYYAGGRTTKNGMESDELQETTRFGATFSFPINKSHSIKLNASTGVFTRTGSDFDSFGIVWQYRWAEGF